MGFKEKLFGGTTRGAFIREGLYGSAAIVGVFNESPQVMLAAFALLVGSVGAHGIANAREESRKQNNNLSLPQNKVAA